MERVSLHKIIDINEQTKCWFTEAQKCNNDKKYNHLLIINS